MKKIVFFLWWAVIFALAMSAVRIFSIFNHYPDKIIFHLVTTLPLSIWFVYEMMSLQAERHYYSKQPICNVVAAGLLEKGNKFLEANDFDKAYDAFLKACETAPEGTFLWCYLAHFCELVRNNMTETDKYMAKAEELILTKKADSANDRACYFNYLGDILYKRGEHEKGLEYMKKSIDIGPNPLRIKSYEEKLSEFKAKQQSTQL
jgi:tetratricopeptide (TPR) repeat protein